MRHETPAELDELFEREEISPDEYYARFNVDRETFWWDFWELVNWYGYSGALEAVGIPSFEELESETD